MALTATMHRIEVALSDVDRGVYEALDLRVAQHPSESLRYLVTRTLAYCLSYEEGIAFSKGGVSSTDEPPVSVRDMTGTLLAWIDVGSPSADRLHKAAKAAPRVELYTHASVELLRREVSGRKVHRLGEIAVHRLEATFLDALGDRLERHTRLELLRTDGHLYVTHGGVTIEGPLTRHSLD